MWKMGVGKYALIDHTHIQAKPAQSLYDLSKKQKKSSTYTWEVLQKFKIVRFRLTYFAQIALTFDRIFYLQKH